MLPELYAGGDGPHIQRAEPGQPLRVPRRPPCRGPNSANDPQNPAPYRLQLLLAVSLIVLAVVIVLVILYRLSGLSLGLSAPPKLQVSSGCSPASSTFVWYLVWWSFFFPSPIIRPCVLAPWTSSSRPSTWASCLSTGLEAKATLLNNNMDCLSLLYACEQ
ncbi:sodium-coupled neutral amino acid transporter 5 isoform X1 [Dipodomys merriami]|uniref:sodium-coupled neutral amino acid transporter 5 isoform X1 n=1 Tax=Dipodomys merriami TaxID=94247 RepID=UPI003855D2FD